MPFSVCHGRLSSIDGPWRRGGVNSVIFMDDGPPMIENFRLKVPEFLKLTKLCSNLYKLAVPANNDEIKVNGRIFD